MKGAITMMPKTAHEYGHVFKSWAWSDSIFFDPQIAYHATWQSAFDHLRKIGVDSVIDGEVTP